MNEIKSKKAIKHLDKYAKAEAGTADHVCIWDAREAIEIAEQEADERHKGELLSVHDMYKQIFIEHETTINTDKYNSERNHQIALDMLRDKAVHAFCWCNCNETNHSRCIESDTCNKLKQFIKKLTEI